MNWSRLGSFLVILCLASLATTSLDVQANSVVKKKKQTFDLAPKKANKPKTKSFIDFSKFNKDASKFGSVKFKPKSKQKQKKKGMVGPDAKFKFGEPVPAPTGSQGHTVSVEMVSLSLVSTSPVSLDPFLGKGSNERGNIVLSLLAPKPKVKAPAKFNPNKKKGELDIKFGKKKNGQKKNGKKFKVSKKKNGVKETKDLNKKKFKALGVGFSSASPITITDPSFCLANGVTANDPTGRARICLAPMEASVVPLPGSLALMAPALAILLTGHIIRRRRRSD